MTFKSKLLAGYSVFALGLGATMGGALAQDAAPAPATPSPAPMQQQAPAAKAADVSEQKLESFAVAFLEVSKISQTYQPQFEKAANDQDKQRIQQEAGQKMVEAVNSTEGISIDEYNQIIQSAQADPDLAQRINGHITEATGGAAAQPAQPAQPTE